MPILRTYPLRIQKFDNGAEMLVIDVRIDGKPKQLLLDTGAQDALVLFEPATKPGRSLTRKGLSMDFSGTIQRVRMQMGSLVTTSEALFLSKPQSNNKTIAMLRSFRVSGLIGFYNLIKYFNTISYPDRQLQFIPEADREKEKIFSIQRVFPKGSPITNDPAFLSDEGLFFLDSGSPVTLELVRGGSEIKAQEIVVKIPSSPLQFTFSGGTYPTKIFGKELPIKVILLGIDFIKRVGSVTITRDKIYLNLIRYTEEKRLACRLSNFEVYKDTSLFVNDFRTPMVPGAKVVYVLGPTLPELVLESQD